MTPPFRFSASHRAELENKLGFNADLINSLEFDLGAFEEIYYEGKPSRKEERDQFEELQVALDAADRALRRLDRTNKAKLRAFAVAVSISVKDLQAALPAYSVAAGKMRGRLRPQENRKRLIASLVYDFLEREGGAELNESLSGALVIATSIALSACELPGDLDTARNAVRLVLEKLSENQSGILSGN
jgi:hypothetical protein